MIPRPLRNLALSIILAWGWKRAGIAAAARPHDRAFLARPNAQPLDAARVGVEHFDLVIAGAGNHLAAHR